MGSNSTRFAATLSLHSVNFLIQGLQAEINGLEDLAKVEDAGYAALMAQTIEVELQNLQLALKASGHDDVDDYIDHIEGMIDSL